MDWEAWRFLRHVESSRGGVRTHLIGGSACRRFPTKWNRLLGERFTAPPFCEQSADAGIGACDYLLTLDVEMPHVSGYRLVRWEPGLQ